MANIVRIAKRNSRSLASESSGFSLVELLVALAFTGILMAGMASVFKSSLSSFYTSGEVISSARRNRASIDLLYDDLNSAGMYLTSLSAPPTEISPGNPAFYILPNQAVAGAGPDDPGSAAHPSSADELYFYSDQPLAFEGKVASLVGAASEKIQPGNGPPPPVDPLAGTTYDIDCTDPNYAKLLIDKLATSMAQVPPKGLSMVFKDSWETLYFTTAVLKTAQKVTITAVGDPKSGVTGVGSEGFASKYKHIHDTAILFYLPSQMVRYSIKMKQLDPQNPAGIPCLVRDQGNYSPGGFVRDPSQETIVTENISGFKAYLSADSGKTWAGTMADGTTPMAGLATWDDLRSTDPRSLDAQLLVSGRQDHTTTAGNDHWFRKIPTLVRLDLTTRTATKRTEYSAIPATAAYRELVQSLVIVPRHFGLPIN